MADINNSFSRYDELFQKVKKAPDLSKNAGHKSVFRKFFNALLMIITLGLLTLTFVHAEVSQSLEKKIVYNVIQQDVKGALKDISTQIGLPINLALNVKGRVASGEYKGQAKNILDDIVSDLNLQWFFDGNSIYVTNISDAQMKIIRLNSFSLTNLQQALINIDLDIQKYPLKHDSYNNMVTIYGPPRYVAMVEVVAHYLTMRAMDKPSVLRGSIG